MTEQEQFERERVHPMYEELEPKVTVNFRRECIGHVQDGDVIFWSLDMKELLRTSQAQTEYPVRVSGRPATPVTMPKWWYENHKEILSQIESPES